MRNTWLESNQKLLGRSKLENNRFSVFVCHNKALLERNLERKYLLAFS